MIPYHPDTYERRIVDVRYELVKSDEYGNASVPDLMDAIEAFTKDVPDAHMISIGGDNLMLYERRYETDEEVITRIEEGKAHALAVQAKADNSWARQKRKFARARKK